MFMKIELIIYATENEEKGAFKQILFSFTSVSYFYCSLAKKN